MAINDPYSKYLENQIMTASPGKRLVMTFDGAIRFTRAAQDCMRKGDLFEQGNNIRKVQNILLELMASLNPKVDEQLAANLDALYTYMFDKLTHANIHDDEKALEEVLGLLTELRSAWAEADMQARAANQIPQAA